MKLEKASYKAVKYACLKYHYIGRMPANPFIAYSVFENDDWCGVIVFNKSMLNAHKPYNLKRGQVGELVRVAMNGKQKNVSKPVSIAVKLLRKDAPLLKLLVSYADSDEGHEGTIYQALNWYYECSKKTGDKYIDPKTGNSVHSSAHSPTGFCTQFGERKKAKKTSDLRRIKKGVKHKYIYPLDKELISMCKRISKPYSEINATVA